MRAIRLWEYCIIDFAFVSAMLHLSAILILDILVLLLTAIYYVLWRSSFCHWPASVIGNTVQRTSRYSEALAFSASQDMYILELDV